MPGPRSRAVTWGPVEEGPAAEVGAEMTFMLFRSEKSLPTSGMSFRGREL
jgi:hypothetical protein